jgi:two-component system, NarL family, nitrate/nitrite response regulator NarL
MNTKRRIRIAMVDDHQIVMDGLIALLKEVPHFEIIATANNAIAMLEILAKNNIDILLSDIVMDGMNGQQLAKEVKTNYPAIKIIALSMSSVGQIVEQMINEADISGYLLKQTGKDELVIAIETVYNGGHYFQQQILDEMEKEANKRKKVEEVHLTIREKEIIQLIDKNLSNKEIAESLFLSVHTIETHRKNILKKTNTNNVLSLLKWAAENGIL